VPIIKVTQADKAKTMNLEPGWYGAKVIKVESPKTSSGGDSLNFGLLYAIDHPSKKEVPVTYNTKLIGKIDEPYKAVFGTTCPEEFDMDVFMGKELDVKIQPVTYNGNLIDNIVAYLPKGKSKDAQPF
jgi:hypothetical protein